MNDKEYFELGSDFENLFISSSCLRFIDPEMGGSPVKFKKFFTEKKEDDESKAMRLGRLIHKFAESPEEFVVADFDQPSDTAVLWAKRTKETIDNIKNEELKSNLLSIIRDTKEVVTMESVKEILDIAVVVKSELNIYASFKKEEVIKNKFLTECYNYFNFLYEAEGKESLTFKEKQIIGACSSSIYNHRGAHYFLFSEKEGIERRHEMPFIFKLKIKEDEMMAKSKIDTVLIDHEAKDMYLVELKTTSTPISLFKWDFRSRKIYRQLAFYLLALKEIREKYPDYTLRVALIVVETTGENETGVFLFEEEDSWFKRGVYDINLQCDRILKHMGVGDWVNPIEAIVQGHLSMPSMEEMIR